MEGPEVQYATSGDVHIAYGVVGDGPMDVVFVSGWVLSNFGVPWEGSAADFYRGMSSFARLILFDKRGLGMSDRAQGIPDLETRMDDIRAVMDAAGSERAAIMGFSEGGPMSVLFAATYPERTAALVLYSTPLSWFRTVKDLVAGSGLTFADRGHVQLKGVPGEWHLYAVNPALGDYRGAEARDMKPRFHHIPGCRFGGNLGDNPQLKMGGNLLFSRRDA